MNDFQFVEQRMELAEHDLAQAKSTIVQRELQLKKALEDLAQLRADRDHFDWQHRIMLQEKNAMQAERDQLKQQLAQCAAMRRACVGICAWWNTPDRDPVETLPIRIKACEQALSTTAGQDLLARLERYEKALEFYAKGKTLSAEVAREALKKGHN